MLANFFIHVRSIADVLLSLRDLASVFLAHVQVRHFRELLSCKSGKISNKTNSTVDFVIHRSFILKFISAFVSEQADEEGEQKEQKPIIRESKRTEVSVNAPKSLKLIICCLFFVI